MAKRQSNARHGMSNTREYRIWKAMINRCRNPNAQDWRYYGGIGIAVCKAWQRSFMAFYTELGPCPARFTIDRIETTRGYMPGNCRWASRATQSKNQRRSYWLTFRGECKHVADWAKETGIPRATLVERINRGLPVKSILTSPLRHTRLVHDGREQSMAEWSRETGISHSVINRRLRRGMSVSQALTVPLRGKSPRKV